MKNKKGALKLDWRKFPVGIYIVSQNAISFQKGGVAGQRGAACVPRAHRRGAGPPAEVASSGGGSRGAQRNQKTAGDFPARAWGNRAGRLSQGGENFAPDGGLSGG